MKECIHYEWYQYVWYLPISIELATAQFYTISIYGVATISRLLKIIGFFCKRTL